MSQLDAMWEGLSMNELKKLELYHEMRREHHLVAKQEAVTWFGVHYHTWRCRVHHREANRVREEIRFLLKQQRSQCRH